nr:hypothetical protein [uncultured Brevundimonas sp.]
MKHLTAMTILAVPLLALGACGSRDAERAAPEASSLEADATSGVAGANPGSTPSAGVADTPARHVDQAGQEGAVAPPPQR